VQVQSETGIEPNSGRRYYLDYAEDAGAGGLTFLLNLHGGGSGGVWQRRYFPAHQYADAYRLVVAAPTAKTREPMRHWAPDVDDAHLMDLVEQILERFGAASIRAFWLVGHSQGGMTANRLLNTAFFADRVDGWLSLSGGRIGQAELVEGFGPPRRREERDAMSGLRARRFRPHPVPDADFSFIFAIGEHEIVGLPETSPWGEKYGAGERVRAAVIEDSEPGQVRDTRWGDRSTPSWGRVARPGTAEIYVYPGARDGRVIADVLRRDKGHTEGLEPRITEEILKLIVAAPGGKAREAAAAPSERTA
jgi:pimeloyl-ACP methyl ester carboxylesterase